MKKLSSTEADLKTCSSFLLEADSFSFVISKRLFHTRFKLNIVHSSRGLIPGTPLNPLRDSQCTQTPAAFYLPIHGKRRIFYLPG